MEQDKTLTIIYQDKFSKIEVKAEGGTKAIEDSCNYFLRKIKRISKIENGN